MDKRLEERLLEEILVLDMMDDKFAQLVDLYLKVRGKPVEKWWRPDINSVISIVGMLVAVVLIISAEEDMPITSKAILYLGKFKH